MKGFIFVMLAVLACAQTMNFCDTYDKIQDASCLKDMFERIVVRAYQSFGKVDRHLVHNIDTAKKANLEVQAYANPCYVCRDPEGQAAEIVKGLEGRTVTMMWVNVQGSWNITTSENVVFLRKMVAKLQALGQKVGIFTFAPTWERIMGKTTDEFSSLPLWYMRINMNPERDDFLPFGGWKKPSAKQYQAHQTECGISLDYDAYYLS